MIQVLWNIDSIQEFLIRFSQNRTVYDNVLIENFKLFIKNIVDEPLQNYMNEDKPVDFDVTGIRESLDQLYKDTKKFNLEEKCDAPEAYEALVTNIYENVEDSKELGGEFEDLVDIKFNINNSYIYVNELLSPIVLTKDDAFKDIEHIKYDLIKYGYSC